MIIKANRMTINENTIQSGDNTHIHCQSIYPVNFNPINSKVKALVAPMPSYSIFYDVFFAIYLV